MSKRKKVQLLSSFLLSIIILGVCIIINVLLHTLLRNWLIINFSVKAFQIISTGGMGVMALCAIWSIINVVQLIAAGALRKREQEQELAQQKQQSQVLANYTEDSTNPDFARQRLQQLWKEMPGTEDLVEQCLEQMDRMDRLQAKQELLITTNDARYLRDTVTVLDNVERRICRNFQKIVNLCIVTDNIERLDMCEIQKYLDDNQKKLDDTTMLLKISAKQVNQYNAGNDDSLWDEVEAWIKTISESLKEE